jgi:ADP-ribose pyrophosphatase YjhB (NUDIX family)
VILDPPIRLAFRTAHLMLRSYWFVRRPHTSGALAALWHGDTILLVKNSYRRQYTLPGGYVRPGEDPRAAASRELFEEVSLRVPPAHFQHVYHGTKDFEFRHDTLDIYEASVDHVPALDVDNREVVWAGFKTVAEARALPIVPHLVEYLEDRERVHAK